MFVIINSTEVSEGWRDQTYRVQGVSVNLEVHFLRIVLNCGKVMKGLFFSTNNDEIVKKIEKKV